jgi:hypothetical protein
LRRNSHKLEEKMLLYMKDLAYYIKELSPEEALKKASDGNITIEKLRSSDNKLAKLLAELLDTGSADEIREMERGLSEAKHFQDQIDKETKNILHSIKFSGTFLLPLMYYFMSAVTGGAMTRYFIIFLGVNMFVISILDYAIRRDLLTSLFYMPVAGTAFYIIITRAGPLVAKYAEMLIPK